MANLSISFISIFFFILNFPFLTSPNIKTNHLLVSLGNLLFLHFCSFFYKLFNNAKKNFIAPFNGWGSTASRLEPLRGGSLLFTTKFPEIPATHFIDLGRMKCWVDLGATQWFWTWDLWIGNPASLPLRHCSICSRYF